MFEDLFTILGMLLAVIVILVLAYYCTRFISSKSVIGQRRRGSVGHMKIVDQLTIGKEQQMLLTCVGERYFLLGVSASEISLLAEITQDEAELWEKDSDGEPDKKLPTFKEAFLENLNRKRK